MCVYVYLYVIIYKLVVARGFLRCKPNSYTTPYYTIILPTLLPILPPTLLHMLLPILPPILIHILFHIRLPILHSILFPIIAQLPKLLHIQLTTLIPNSSLY